MNRDTVIWTLVAFFGATVAFGLLRNATKDEGVAVSLGAQTVLLVVIVGVLVLVFRRRE